MKRKNIIFIPLTLLLLAAISCNAHYYMPSNSRHVYTGLERFMGWRSGKYRNRQAVVITNHSGLDCNLNTTVELLRSRGIIVRSVLAPEHGLHGYRNSYDDKISYQDRDNITVYNLHKLDRHSLSMILIEGDFVIFDIQDMGMRCYTYVSNLKFIMDTLNGSDMELIVLDRPNPVGFLGISGPFLEKKFRTKMVSAFPSPLLYDMTIGEAARYYKGVYAKNVNLRIIKMKNYSRDMYFHETELPWIPPSPNLPGYGSAIMYSAVVLMEGLNISLGRGTTKPFEYIGAPWIDPVIFCRDLSRLGLKNFRFRPVHFKPTFNKFEGEVCRGAHILYTGGRFDPVEVSYRIIRHIKEKYPQAEWTTFNSSYDIDYLAGTDKFRKYIDRKLDYEQFTEKTRGTVKWFKKKRRKYLLY